MNLPNKLTLLRIILILPFLLILYLGVPYADYIALAVFIIASLTDMLENPLEVLDVQDGTVSLTFKPYEIHTWRFD